MQVTMFKGLFPVNLPDDWFSDIDKIKFANNSFKEKSSQTIDFRPNEGKCLTFWIESNNGIVTQHWKEETENNELAFTDKAIHICSRQEVKFFGQSANVLDLKHL